MYNKCMDIVRKVFEPVEATCVEVLQRKDGSTTIYTPVYEYVFEDKKYNTKNTLKLSYREHANYPRVGESRELKVDVVNPSVIKILDDSQFNSLQFDHHEESAQIKRLRHGCTRQTTGKIQEVIFIGNDIHAPVANYIVRAKYLVDGEELESKAFVIAVLDTEIFDKEIEIAYNPAKPHEFYAPKYATTSATGFTQLF